MDNQQTMGQFEILGNAMYPMFNLIETLENEKKGTFISKSKKVQTLKLLETKWKIQFPKPSPNATNGAAIVIGILVHILSPCISTSSPDGSLCEAALETIAVVLEGCENFTEFLPSHSVMRIISITSMCFPSPMAEEAIVWHRSEEGVFAAVRCINALLLPLNMRTVPNDKMNWLHTPGSGEDDTSMQYKNKYFKDIAKLFEETEEGKGVLAQLIQSMLVVVRGGEEGGGWPKRKLPRETSLTAVNVLNSTFELLHHNSILWRSFVPGISSQLYKVISKGSIAPTTNNMPSISNAVISATSAGSVGGGGFATVSDLTRRNKLASSKLIANSLILLTKVLTLVCRDEITSSFMPKNQVAEGNESFSNMMKALRSHGDIVESSLPEAEPSEVDIQWRRSFLDRIKIVLEDSFAVARRHNSWRVRTSAVACCELLLQTCRVFLGIELVVVLVESLAVISQHEVQPQGGEGSACDSTDVSAGTALKKLRVKCDGWEWREILVLIQQRLDKLISSFRLHGRVAGARVSGMTDAFQLSTGLLHILSASSTKDKGPPLPLQTMSDAVSGLFMPDKGPAVLAHVGNIAFFRRSLVHLDDSSAMLATKLLREVGKEAGRSESVVSLLGHMVTVLNSHASAAVGLIEDEDSEEEGERGRVWWAQLVTGCDKSFASTVALNHILTGMPRNSSQSNPSFVQMCHHMTHLLIEDSLWVNESPPHVDISDPSTLTLENNPNSTSNTIVSRSENGIASRVDVQQTPKTSNLSVSMSTVWGEARSWAIAARLECLSLIASLLGSDFQDEGLLMTCLYAVLCKAADPHPAVRQAAVSTLTLFARHSMERDDHDLEDDEKVCLLLSDNLDYIVDAFCEGLRSIQNSNTSQATTSMSVLEFLMKSSATATSTPLLRDVLAAVLKEVDRNSSLSPPPTSGTVLALVSCLSALVGAVSDEITVVDEIDKTYVNESKIGHKPNIAMLSLLVELGEESVEDKEEKVEDDEKGTKSLEDIRKLMIDDTDIKQEEPQAEEEEEEQQDVGTDTQLLLDLLPRLGYLLRFPNIKVQVASINCLESVVRKLKTKKKLLLPAVHDAWPSFIASLQPSTQKSERRRNHNDKELLNPIESSLAIAACELMTTLAEVTGDFLSFKFTEDIWPSISFLLNTLGSNINQSSSNGYERMSDRRLRVALLACCNAIATNKASQRFIIPVALHLTNLALPFLGEKQEGSEEAFILCSTLALIAPDTVWFSLWTHLGSERATLFAKKLSLDRMGYGSHEKKETAIYPICLYVSPLHKYEANIAKLDSNAMLTLLAKMEGRNTIDA